MTIKKNGTYPQVSSPPEKHWKGKEMQFDSFGRVLALLRRGSALPWRRGLKLKVSRDPPVTVEEREEVGGGGEKPDPAEEGKEDEEDGGGGGGEEEGERDEGGCCQLEEWLDAVGDSPLTLGHPLLEGLGVINQLLLTSILQIITMTTLRSAGWARVKIGASLASSVPAGNLTWVLS